MKPHQEQNIKSVRANVQSNTSETGGSVQFLRSTLSTAKELAGVFAESHSELHANVRRKLKPRVNDWSQLPSHNDKNVGRNIAVWASWL